jgi:hypothetical protein
MRVFSVPVSVPFLRSIIAALVQVGSGPQRLGEGLRSQVFGRGEITFTERMGMRVQLYRLFEA